MTRQWWTLTWLVARREIMDRGRAKSFWVATVLLVVAVAAAAVIPALLKGGPSTARIGIVGNTPALTAAAREAGKITGTPVAVVSLPDAPAAAAQLQSGTLDAVLVGSKEVLVKQVSVFGSNGIATTLSQIVGLEKLFAQLPPAAVQQAISQHTTLPVRGLKPPGRSAADRFTGLAVAILMYIILLTYGVRITIGVGEEKASRVVEVLLSTLRPVQLLAGKVIGMGLLAIGQIFAIVATYLILGHAVGATAVRGASTNVVLAGALWLLLGYAFYCTAFAAAGALISRQSDAYNAALAAADPAHPGLRADLHGDLLDERELALPRAGVHPVHRAGRHARAGRGRGGAGLADRGLGGHHDRVHGGHGAAGGCHLRARDPAHRRPAQGAPGAPVVGLNCRHQGNGAPAGLGAARELAELRLSLRLVRLAALLGLFAAVEEQVRVVGELLETEVAVLGRVEARLHQPQRER